jgi:hypothetical protein
MSIIKVPNIPTNTYPTNDTLITMTVDTDEIFTVTDQEGVIGAVTFTDNRRDDRDEGPAHDTMLIKNNFVTWVGAVKRADLHPFDKVMIYDVSEVPAFARKAAASGPGRTHVDGKSAGHGVPAQDYSIVFWVWNDSLKQGKAFQVDPKLGVNN